MFNHVFFLVFNLYLYRHVYELVPSVADKLPYANAVWSMSMYFAVFWLGLNGIEKVFRQDILSGNVEIYMLRPISYIWQKILTQLGQGILPFISATVFSVSINYFVVGLPSMNISMPLWIMSLILIFLLSQILITFLYVLCGLSGFWFQNSESMYFVTSKLVMILGGAWVPIAFFPEFLQAIARFSPFGGAMALSFAMYPNFDAHFLSIILNIIFWIAIFAFITYFVSNKTNRKLAVNG